jgi:uncharacterized protein (DUF2236 family)
MLGAMFDHSRGDRSWIDPEVAGLYGPDSIAWQINREALMILASGPRALLLQLAHPLVAEGVDQHSDFRSDPWARLVDTIRSYTRIVYGTTRVARAEIRRLNAMHRSITGPVRDPVAKALTGQPAYAARDPALSLWVHATLVESTMVGYDAWIAPLGRDERARYYAETMPVARGLGVTPDLLPPDLDSFEAYIASMLAPDGPVHPTPSARDLAYTVLHPPLGPIHPLLGLLPGPAYDWTAWPAVGLLPEGTRHEYGLAWGPLEQAVSRWLVAGFRMWRPLLPSGFRMLSAARRADERVRAQ